MVWCGLKIPEEVLRIKEEFEEMILNLNEVNGVDIRFKSEDDDDLSNFFIIVYVSNKKKVMGNDILPGEVKGIPVVVEERSFVLH